MSGNQHANKESWCKEEAVCRTAVDALQAKYSAICLAQYPSLVACEENGAADVKIQARDLIEATQDVFQRYASLLRTMVGYFCINKSKRQTPLVNVGYAVRVSCVLDTVARFATFHERMNAVADGSGGDVQIVVLGAGLDVISIWLGDMISSSSSSTTTNVRLIDVDFKDTCHAKKDAFRTLGIIIDSPDCSKRRSPNIIFEGYRQGCERIAYTLVGGDLRDPIFTENLFAAVIHPSLPTMVLSELVLAYLPTVACDDLLRRCAAMLSSRATNCCMLLFEPLGPCPNSPGSVLEACKHSYCDQFNSKLARGQSQQNAKAANADIHFAPTFFPLGISTRSVELRMQMAGFRRARASTAGLVASLIPGLDWKQRELFDEHAALILHLSSYTVTIGFNDGSDSIFQRHMFAGGASTGLLGRPRPFYLKGKNNSWAWLAEIVRQDENQVRELFAQTYQHLFAMHPAIQKMVTTALRKDLIVAKGIRQDDAEPEKSSIGEHYKRLNGVFLVCVRLYHPTFSGVDRLPSKRQLLAGIGSRKCTNSEIMARKMPIGFVVYEIHRLFVDNQARGCGVGTSLLRLVIDHIQEAESRGNGTENILLLATTPAVLDGANLFYISRGFEVHAETFYGGTLMRTYVKTVGNVKQQ